MSDRARIIIFILAGVGCLATYSAWMAAMHPSQRMEPDRTEAALQAPKSAYSIKAVSDATAFMDAAKVGANIYEEGPHLVVEMRQYVQDPNVLLRYARRIADADCVVNGGPRNIYFYDPSMKKVAQADTLNGVRLKD